MSKHIMSHCENKSKYMRGLPHVLPHLPFRPDTRSHGQFLVGSGAHNSTICRVSPAETSLGMNICGPATCGSGASRWYSDRVIPYNLAVHVDQRGP
jgi:hypothetical protein